MEMRDRERGTVFWSFGYPENIDQTHQLQVKISLTLPQLIEERKRNREEQRGKRKQFGSWYTIFKNIT